MQAHDQNVEDFYSPSHVYTLLNIKTQFKYVYNKLYPLMLIFKVTFQTLIAQLMIVVVIVTYFWPIDNKGSDCEIF